MFLEHISLLCLKLAKYSEQVKGLIILTFLQYLAENKRTPERQAKLLDYITQRQAKRDIGVRKSRGAVFLNKPTKWPTLHAMGGRVRDPSLYDKETKQVPIKSIHKTERLVGKAKVLGLAKSMYDGKFDPSRADAPARILRKGGKDILINGHHRAEAARLNRDSNLLATVYTPKPGLMNKLRRTAAFFKTPKGDIKEGAEEDAIAKLDAIQKKLTPKTAKWRHKLFGLHKPSNQIETQALGIPNAHLKPKDTIRAGWKLFKAGFQKSAERDVPLDSIVTRQPAVDARTVKKKILSSKRTHPALFVRLKTGQHMAFDGNHQAVADRLLGRKTMKGRVVDLD